MVQVIKNAALAGHLKTEHSGKILSSPETTPYSTVSAITSKRILKKLGNSPQRQF